MNSNVQNKIKAISLRMQGFSYSEIMNEVPVPRSTLSGWLRHIRLTNDQENLLSSNLEKKKRIARSKASVSNRKRRENREFLTKENAIKKYNQFYQERDFVIGLALYWAEGTKKDVTCSFINSDPEMVSFMYRWMVRYLGVSPESIRVRLFIHLPYKDENLELFWANLLGVSEYSMQKTIYKETPHLVKKNPLYKGCVRIYITGIEHLRTVISWKDALVNSLKV